MPTSVALSTHFDHFVREQVDSGRYNNVSEVVRAGLRLLEDKERIRDEKLVALRAEIEKGMSGKAMPLDGVLDRLEAKYRKLAQGG